GVTIVGWFNLASSLPNHASQLYARNITSFLTYVTKDGNWRLSMEDEITRETLVTRDGQIVHKRVRESFGLPAAPAQPWGEIVPADFLSNLYVFILAGLVGFELIKRVSPLLHTPLMSLTNALDAIVVVAAIIIAGRQETPLATALGAIAVAASFSNMVGGFVI